MTHNAVYAGRKVAYPCNTIEDKLKVEKIARDVTKLMIGQGLHNVAHVNIVGNIAVVEVR